jgi:hypothetical protein
MGKHIRSPIKVAFPNPISESLKCVLLPIYFPKSILTIISQGMALLPSFKAQANGVAIKECSDLGSINTLASLPEIRSLPSTTTEALESFLFSASTRAYTCGLVPLGLVATFYP